tara:strand:- start:906 stop:2045 length:1140 start_codon:yes stop_codon:yes gene_type:complete
MKIKICKNCIQPDTRPNIYFNEEGICGACLWEQEKETINWHTRENELQEIADNAKKNTTSNYDCVIGVSGGKDSTFQAITARDKLGLNCLLINYQPESITDIGIENIENLKTLGFDSITVRPNPEVMKKLIRSDFFQHLNPVKVTEFALYACTYIMAEKFNIPLIIQGENPAYTLGISAAGVGKDSNALNVKNFPTLSSGWKPYVGIDGVSEKDLFLYHYDKEKLEEKGIRAIWLQYYRKEWSQTHNAEFSRKYGLKWRDEDFDPSEFGTYSRFTGLDSEFNPLNQMLKYIKFGFGHCLDQACYDLREKRITRNEAINLVLKYDGKCSEKYIQNLCDFIKITVDDFWSHSNKFRGKMWKKNNVNEWVNEFETLLRKEIK